MNALPNNDLANGGLANGDRVRAISRPGFPTGTVIKLLDAIYVLVKWDGDVLETADHRKLTKVASDST